MSERVVTQEYLDGLLDEIERLRAEVQRGCPHVIPPADRFHALYKKLGEDDCWLWLGTVNNGGYGKFNSGGGKKVYAHRWSYEYHKGKIPDGYHIDHLCWQTLCVNPNHLRAVTPEVNNRRKRPKK